MYYTLEEKSTHNKIISLLELAEKLLKDPDSVERTKTGRCPLCFYSVAIAGQAITKYTCERCGGVFYHPNTKVPKFCLSCGQKGDMCVHCGADLKVVDHQIEAFKEKQK